MQASFNDRYRGEDMKLTMSLVVTNSRGEQRTNELVRYRKRENVLTQGIYRFVGPADLRGTTTLTLEQSGESEDLQWMYLPSLKKLRRVASADRGKSWAGTDFWYEDLRDKKLNDYDYSSLGSEMVGEFDCHHYSMTPKSAGRSPYGKVEYWVRKDLVELIRGKYYDKNGRWIKEMNMTDLRPVMDAKKNRKIWSAMHIEMVDLNEKHRTDIFVHRIVYNTGIPDQVFSPQGIESVPDSF